MHEHLEEFGLINMNARMYDPVLARFLSPDPHVQAPSCTQSYNRYAYAFNSPLMYVDPDGEWFWLVPLAAGFAQGYLSHGIRTGDWGWNAVGSGAIGAGTALAAYFAGGALSAHSLTNQIASCLGSGAGVMEALAFSGKFVGSSLLNSVMPSYNIPIGNTFAISISPGFGFGLDGFTGGFNYTATGNIGNFSFSYGFGVGTTNTVHGGVSYYDRKRDQYFSYYATHFGGAHSQTVGGIGYRSGKFSLRVENDIFGDGRDRWRTSAVQIGHGDVVVGKRVYTNSPNRELDRIDYTSTFWNRLLGIGERKAYADGRVYNSPFYIGLRQGNTISRIGINHPIVQDIFQNGWHIAIRSPLFPTPYGSYSGSYGFRGVYNPFTLY